MPDPKEMEYAIRPPPDPAPQAAHQEARRLAVVRPRRALEADRGALTAAEAAVHAAVAKQAAALDEQAAKLKAERDRYALRLVATILRKRAASSLAALRETVANRLDNLEQQAEDVELRRDHLRSLRKGETIADEDLEQLERDAHRSFLARIRSAGKVLRAIEAEMEDLLDLQGLLAKCPTDTESKAEALLAELRAIHPTSPTRSSSSSASTPPRSTGWPASSVATATPVAS